MVDHRTGKPGDEHGKTHAKGRKLSRQDEIFFHKDKGRTSTEKSCLKHGNQP